MTRARMLAAVSFLLAVAAPAGAAQVATTPGGFLAGWVPPVVVIAEGEGITYSNADIAPHNFIASDAMLTRKAAKKAKWCSGYDKGKCPLFWSPTIGTGETTEVSGLSKVKAGEQYGFFCSLHPNMQGTLIVR
jgi:plastocyanin